MGESRSPCLSIVPNERLRESTKRVPAVQAEYAQLEREYEVLRENHIALLERREKAQYAEALDTKAASVQFRVIDPARLPERPVEPDVQKIMLLTLLIGLGLGCGIAYLFEIMDTSFRNPEDVENELNIPILVSMPFRYTDFLFWIT